MIEEIRKVVYDACMSDKNFWTETAWTHHTVFVVEFAKKLARKLNADEEICELAALLHDYAGILDKNLYEEHHSHGARLAEEILSKYNYPQEKIDIIKHAILAHRHSKQITKNSIYDKIIADSDVLAHFESVEDLFHLAFSTHKLKTEEGTKFVLSKLERGWNSLTLPESKELIREKYEQIKRVFNS